ncbi:MAG TPA: rod shape-determining protein MreC [Burkholderiales bacterium]|nr:rod shape-determining protein MreC [Burkholderiales bacterium]
MEHTPPPFFKTGPSPLARLLFFSALSLALLIADARFKHLEVIRQVVSVAIYPLQRIAAAPVSLLRRAGDFFVTHAALHEENVRLLQENLASGTLTQKTRALEAENVQLRKLLEARERRPEHSTLAEVLYAARDPFSQRIVIDKGTQHDVQNGQPVIDASGVVGQVTRTYPMLAEVTLITDKGHLVPVLNVRSGLRSVLAGTGVHGALEMQFVPLNADVQKGDQLVTSGIDGIYAAGLPVAEVVSIESNPTATFSKVTCRPLGGVGSHTRLFVVHGSEVLPPRPPEDVEKMPRGRKGRKGG